MERLSVLARRPIAGRTINPNVEVVAVRVAMRGLHHHGFSARDHICASASTASRSEQPLLERVGDEDELHAGIGVRDEAGDELPVPVVVEAQRFVRGDAVTEPVESSEREGLEGASRGVAHVERDVGVAPVLVGAMARDGTAMLGRKLAHAQAGPGKTPGDVGGRPLEEVHEFGRPEEVARRAVLAGAPDPPRFGQLDAAPQPAPKGETDRYAVRATSSRLAGCVASRWSFVRAGSCLRVNVRGRDRCEAHDEREDDGEPTTHGASEKGPSGKRKFPTIVDACRGSCGSSPRTRRGARDGSPHRGLTSSEPNLPLGDRITSVRSVFRHRGRSSMEARMLVVVGEASYAERMSRVLEARGIAVDRTDRWESSCDPATEPLTVVVVGDDRELRERAVRALSIRRGEIVWVTERAVDDPEIVALRRRGVPYSIVVCPRLEDPPPPSGWILVPNDFDIGPTAAWDDVAARVAERIQRADVGTGDLEHAPVIRGAAAWVQKLRAAGWRAYAVPRWVARIASVFGVARLEARGGRPVVERGWWGARSSTELLLSGSSRRASSA